MVSPLHRPRLGRLNEAPASPWEVHAALDFHCQGFRGPCGQPMTPPPPRSETTSGMPEAIAAPPRRYGLVAIVLHWVIAAMIVTNLALAWRFEGLEGAERGALIRLHKS